MEQVLFYKAQSTGNMWDTWLYWHKGTYYLFHLAGPGCQWYGIAMATSGDGVHWHEHGLVLEKAEGVTWMGTGTVWEAPSHGSEPRFMMNFSEWRGNAQTIFFAESSDLLHWRRLGNEHEFRPDGRWYRTGGGNDGRWDCICTIDRPGGGRYGYWTANPINFTGFGFGETDDGVTWRALPPPVIEWGAVAPMSVIESGAVAEIGGRYYTMLGSYAAYNSCSSGMFTFVADKPAGPFRPMSANYLLLTSPPGRMHTYFARFFPKDGELLFNHHAVAHDGEVYFAPLKLAEVDKSGALRLKWWNGNTAATKEWKTSKKTYGTLSYDPSAGMLIEGSLRISQNPEDVKPTILVDCDEGQRATSFSIHAVGIVDIEEIAADGSVSLLERIDRQLGLIGSVSVRVLLMHSFVELYLDDHLIQVHSLPAKPAGRLFLCGVEQAAVRKGS